jgi:DNA-binding MarR family transcriptional regulator
MISRQLIGGPDLSRRGRLNCEIAMSEFLDLHGKTTKALRALAEEAMRRHGLHLGQNHLLAALWERDGSTPGEIAGLLHVTPPTVVKMATRMAAAGLLTRRREDRDSRLVRLWLTDEGRALQKPIEAERRWMEEKVTADLTETERRHLLSALAKIHRSARALMAADGEETG